jgi:protein-tyrosine phosphatase
MPRRILFVCTGNICRSPTAEGVARGLAEKAGPGGGFRVRFRRPPTATTSATRPIRAPSPRRGSAATTLAHLRARRVTDFDFIRFDHVIAMERDHLEWLQRACPPLYHDKLALLLEFSETLRCRTRCPIPYYGGMDGFERVLDLVEDAVEQLLLRLKQR